MILNTPYKGFRRYITAVVAVMLMCGCGIVSASPEALKQAAEHAILGQWKAALETLESITESTDSRTEILKGLLQEHLALTKHRQQQRLSVVDEKNKMLDAIDPNALDNEAAALAAMELFKSAWDNAADGEREILKNQPLYQILRRNIHERFSDDEKAGRWDAAWSNWLHWLVIFEPDVYRPVTDDLQRRRTITNALRKNPCDENTAPYAQITNETVVRIFEILQNRYAEPVSFERLAAEGLRQLNLLPKVLGNTTFSFAVDADPNGFAEWAEHLEQLIAAELPTSSDQLAVLLETLTAVNQTTLKLSNSVIVALFTEAALTVLDPYTEAVWPDDVSSFEKSLTGQFGGIGIRIKKEGNDLIIVSVIPNTPAAQTILAADDVIMAIDGQPTDEMTTDCAVKRISGPVNTDISLTIHRPGLNTGQTVTVRRQMIILPTVEGSQRADSGRNTGHWDYFLDAKDRIGYLQLNGFTDKTADQARQVLEQLEKDNVAGLIIDVRGNGGGLLCEATAFADLFIDDGLLLSSRGRGGSQNNWQATPNPINRGYPIVILMDEGSASASEIVAGILTVRNPSQTTLIGQRTYGKGTVQEVADLGKTGGRLKLTTAAYYLPDGRPVQNRFKLQAAGRSDWGIAPDVEILLYPYEKTQVRQIQLERRKQLMARETPADLDTQNESLTHRMLTTDAQLSTALVVLKAKILAAD